MLEARGIDFAELDKQESIRETSGDEAGRTMREASGDGYGFAVSGGVAQAVVNYIKEMHPDREIKVESAEGLDNCRKLLTLAKAGKYNGYLLEGMACPGGCVAGAGTVQPINKSQAAVKLQKKNAVNAHAIHSSYKDLLEQLEERNK